MKTRLALILLYVALSATPLLAQGTALKDEGRYTVKEIRGGESGWLRLSGKRTFLYRLANDGPYPVQVWSKTEVDKGSVGKPLLVLRPGETHDLLLNADSYTFRLPEGGESSGRYTLLEHFEPEPSAPATTTPTASPVPSPGTGTVPATAPTPAPDKG